MKICGTKSDLPKAIQFSPNKLKKRMFLKVQFYPYQIKLTGEIIMIIQEIISKFPANILNRR